MKYQLRFLQNVPPQRVKYGIVILLILIQLTLQSQVWTPVSGLPVSVALKTVKFIDISTGWVAGENGTIMKTTDGGATWAVQTSGITSTIRSIFFLDANNGWACGDGGSILRTLDGGTSWTPQSSPFTTQYNSIRFATATTGWLVGAGNVLLKTINGGDTWVQQQNQGVSMWGLEVLTTLSAWTCGGFNNTQGSPTLLKTNNGTNWSPQNNSGVSSFITFNDIRFTDANNGWIVGGSGIIRHTTDGGASPWTSQNSGTQAELLSVDFINASVGYACGRDGVIIATSNGGTTWVGQSSSITSGALWEIDMVNDTLGFAVGDVGILRHHVYVPIQPIDLLQPNTGGEIFQIGTKRFIIWQSQAGISSVKLQYSTAGNTGPWTTIVASTPAAVGSYSWNVPNTSSVNCYVRISDVQNGNVFDVSNAPFYILTTPRGLDYSVLTSAMVSTTPATINVSWVADANALSYSLDRKLPADTSWTNLTTLPGTTNNYADNAVTPGIIYEYRVVKTTPSVTGYGYLYAGIDIAPTESRGTLLLAVEQTFAVPLQTELALLRNDLIADGWKVIQREFPATTKDTTLKHWVTDEYSKPGAAVKSLLIIGHFAIPYSGNFAPDGHTERVGAQPADVFYADVDGMWTDFSVTTNNTGQIYTPNVPNDGYWDPSTIPSPAELQVGRIDMRSMTGFPLSEVDLLRQYLNKNHAYRFKTINPDRKGLLNIHLDNSLPSTSAVAWRSFAPMLGSDHIAMINTAGCTANSSCAVFMDSLQAHSYLWTYMAGGGSDTSCADPVLTSSQCINQPMNTVFMQLYGSYFVEWAKGGITGTTNHLLRAPLANSGMPLATCWTGGNPRWYFQHMGLGESIGFSTLQSQNNKGIYNTGSNQLMGGVHMALMGDPSLRLHMVHPVTNLLAAQAGTSVQLNWTASADNDIVGYHVYRADSMSGTFTKLNSALIVQTSYTDTMPTLTNDNVYMVRAVKHEIVPSGTYFNMSSGNFISKSLETTFTFSGNGSWSTAGNWENNLKPPAMLPAGFTIIIDPVPGGQCVLDVVQHIAGGAEIHVVPGASFLIELELDIH
ncbi:MAG: hypothetical protein IPN29_02840 [Saprospiraceae bacterium]|nr:hypothetical protein [Saprospiraceae bacterium]